MSDFYEVLPGMWVACPMDDCRKTSKGWKNTEVHCSSCTTHAGVQCPNCDSVIDLGHHDLARMIAAAELPHRVAPGVYCSKGHAGKQVMYCDACEVIWSTCCGEGHECGVVAGSGALYPVHADRIFRRGDRVKVTFRGTEVVSVTSGPATPDHDPLDGWAGWEG